MIDNYISPIMTHSNNDPINLSWFKIRVGDRIFQDQNG